jgi:hypothetical protein
MCEDTAGYVDSQGLNCSSHIGYECRNEGLYTEESGYSLEDWQDIVESCPESCGLCESSGETWRSAVPQPFTVMIVLVHSHPHVSDGCLLMNGPMLLTFAFFAVFVSVM